MMAFARWLLLGLMGSAALAATEDLRVELVRDIAPGPAGSQIDRITVTGGDRAWFRAFDGQRWRLWTSDGTPDGTQPITVGNADAIVSFGQVFEPLSGGRLVFEATTADEGSELWVSDGTAEGTQMIRDMTPGSGSTAFTAAGGAGGLVYLFRPGTGLFGNELWVTDGTDDGTRRIAQGFGRSAEAGNFSRLGDVFVFSANDGTNGLELWLSTGLASGTGMLRDLAPGPEGSSPRMLTPGAGFVFFTADDGSHGREPWVSDGTPVGTFLLRDIRPGSAATTINWTVTSTDGRVWFIAEEASGPALWRTDGTPEGTERIRLLNDGGADPPTHLTRFGTGVAFRYRNALWMSAGTPEGTRQLADVTPGAFTGLVPMPMFADAAGYLIFASTSVGRGNDLWATDGTPEGTLMISAERPASWGFSLPVVERPAVLDERTMREMPMGVTVLLTASDGATGMELWRVQLPLKTAVPPAYWLQYR